MDILVTGVAGFIGSKISEEALKRGYSVFGVDDLSQGYEKNIPIGVEFIKSDLSKKTCLDSLPEKIDVILHLAGQSSGEISFDDPVLDLEKNTVSTLNLIEYGIEKKVKKLVYASSMSVYGAKGDKAISEEALCSPLSCYGSGKLAAENYLRVYQNQLPFIAFRMFNVYGPGQDLSNLRQGMLSIYLQHALDALHIPVKGSLKRYRDFVYIDDVIEIWLQAVTNNKANNHVFNLGTGIKTTVEDLLSKIKSLLPDVSWSEVSGTPGDQFGIYADITKLSSFFDQDSFCSLDEGLRKFMEFSK